LVGGQVHRVRAAAELLRAEQDPLPEEVVMHVPELAAMAITLLGVPLLPGREPEPGVGPGPDQAPAQELKHSPTMDGPGPHDLLSYEGGDGWRARVRTQRDSRSSGSSACRRHRAVARPPRGGPRCDGPARASSPPSNRARGCRAAPSRRAMRRNRRAWP